MAKPSKLKAILGKIWDEMAPAVAHGSSELGAAMYSGSGSGYVMYARGGQEPVTMESLRAEIQAKEQSMDARGLEQNGPEKGGREL
jgi:hypothetical protein